MAWVSVLFLFLEQMLSLTFCQKLTRKLGPRKGPLVRLDSNVGGGLPPMAASGPTRMLDQIEYISVSAVTA
ncbi:hypothetical protein, partial [Pseudomonas sp. 31 R 17]|uniref:hypothetical protein n=1 Tax=Pseudomonas sp. 31 R 17 TaxID=1844101 RepID=UPI001C4005B0